MDKFKHFSIQPSLLTRRRQADACVELCLLNISHLVQKTQVGKYSKEQMDTRIQ
jgi:hypothetical protein